MEFFNFGSTETFHFWTWITAGKGADPQELLRQAFDRLEVDPDVFEGECVSLGLRKHLSWLLDELLDRLWSDLVPLTTREEWGYDDIGTVGTLESLFNPLLVWAINKIDTGAVAEALLIKLGKWAPDTEIPEI
jgi:hypothetical protein